MGKRWVVNRHLNNVLILAQRQVGVAHACLDRGIEAYRPFVSGNRRPQEIAVAAGLDQAGEQLRITGIAGGPSE